MTKAAANDLIGTAEAARLLGVSMRRVQQLIRCGLLAAVPVGRTWAIRRADLAAAEERNRKRGWPKGKERGGAAD
jgi:excisionase family DNA binding protein